MFRKQGSPHTNCLALRPAEIPLAKLTEGIPMHLERNTRGDWFLDPEQLASQFGAGPGQFRHDIRLGLVSSRIEIDRDEDQSNIRVTVRFQKRTWRGVFDEHGSLIRDEGTSVS